MLGFEIGQLARQQRLPDFVVAIEQSQRNPAGVWEAGRGLFNQRDQFIDSAFEFRWVTRMDRLRDDGAGNQVGGLDICGTLGIVA